jgi:SNF2 family DNA or RNA helicase
VYNTRSKATATEYPEVVEKTVQLKMNPAFMAEYNKVQNKESKMFKGANYEVFYNGLRRAVNSIKKEHSPKVDFIIDTIVEGLQKNPRNKALVFSHFIESGMKLVTKRLDQLKIPYAHIDGSMTKKKRQEAVQLYNENMIKVLLISKAGGEGLDLKGTRQIFIMEPAWNSTTVEQVIGRGVRYRSHAHLPQSERKVHITVCSC